MHGLNRTIHWLNVGFAILAGVCMILMMVHITTDVAVRSLFNGRIVGTLEVVSFYYMVGLVFLAFGYVEMKNENIRVDLFVQLLPKAIQFAFYLFACALSMAFFALLFWQSFDDAWTATLRGEEAMSNIRFYIWPARWALPIGFAGLVLASAANFLTAIKKRQAL